MRLKENCLRSIWMTSSRSDVKCAISKFAKLLENPCLATIYAVRHGLEAKGAFDEELCICAGAYGDSSEGG